MFRKVSKFVLLLCLFQTISVYCSTENFRKSYTFKNGIFRLPLTIADNSGVDRERWPVTSGVPLPIGIVKKVSDLSLTDKNGNEIPCQFKVLSRYFARDNSLRWVLLDFQIDLIKNNKQIVYLTNKPQAISIADPIKVQQKKNNIIINTGKLTVSISKKNGYLFNSVKIKDQEVIKEDVRNGPFIKSGEIREMEHFNGSSWNTHGWEHTKRIEKKFIRENDYLASQHIPDQVSLETSGPLRTVVAVKGKFLPASKGKGVIKEGLYRYTSRIHFYKNKTFVKVDHSIENSETRPPLYNYMFVEAGLQHGINLNKDAQVTVCGVDKDKKYHFKTIKYDQPVVLFQKAGNTFKKHGRSFSTSGNYTFAAKSREQSLNKFYDKGHEAIFLNVSDSQKGVSVGMRYMWQEAPKAIEIEQNLLRVLIHADTSRYSPNMNSTRYDLDFGERSISDVFYYFHKGKVDSEKSKKVLLALNYPLFAYSPPDWVADSEAWYFEISPEKGTTDKRIKNFVKYSLSTIGYRKHGYNRGYNSGGHHESLNSGWLSFMRTGNLAGFEKNIVLSRWAISHNPGWVFDGNIPPDPDNGQSLKEIDIFYNKWNRLSGFGPKDFYLWRDSEKKKSGSSYLNKYKWLPDMEHYALFRLFEYYYLTGDQKALDSIYGFVNWAVNFQHKHLFKRKMKDLSVTDYFEKDQDALRRGHYSRVYTWMLYTTLNGYHATGNKVYNQYAIWQIRRMLSLLRHRHGQLTSWSPKPSKATGILSKKLQKKMAENSDVDFFRQKQDVEFSRAQTWMEAQGVMALHEAYKTYGDERILDGIWGLADYFSHHVLYFPELGMLNQWTSMPSSRFDHVSKIIPQRHDRHIQMLPILYHYTGWKKIKNRYQGFEKKRKFSSTRDWFLQTGHWERITVKKKTGNPPEAIKDLRVVQSDRSGVHLTWTSPKDDGLSGHAQRYFVKYSDKPIVEFAPGDHPKRKFEKDRIIKQVEKQILSTLDGNRPMKRYYKLAGDLIIKENLDTLLWDKNWDKVDSFWMAEHVDGEPVPSNAGEKEVFKVKFLAPHNSFGNKDYLPFHALGKGIYYFAICSWDEDNNLSRLSNVAKALVN